MSVPQPARWPTASHRAADRWRPPPPSGCRPTPIDGFTWRARRTNNSIDGESGWSNSSEPSGYACSRREPSASRLVANTDTPAPWARTASTRSPTAGSTCSQLSSTSRIFRCRQNSAMLCVMVRPGCCRHPMACPIAAGTASAEPISASSHSQHPVGVAVGDPAGCFQHESGLADAANTDDGHQVVRRNQSRSPRSTSRSRPIRASIGAGRLPSGATPEPIGGNSSRSPGPVS